MIKQICSVDGCGNPHNAKGYCDSHYARWKRHGDPTLGGAAKGDLMKFIDRALKSNTDSCVIWTFGKGSHGYGEIRYEGKMQTVPRLVCKLAHGASFLPSAQAAHSCGNRACINPKHLRWATPIDNNADKLIHGTVSKGEKHGMAILSDANVLEIWNMKGKKSQKDLAKEFGVSRQTITNIHTKIRWGWLTCGVSA